MIPRSYHQAEVYARERERIFAHTWQLTAQAAALGEPGSYQCAEVVDEPIVLTRDATRLRGFFNVCRHRAGPVASGCGRRQTLQCAYHGWTYGLDGRLLRAPEMDDLDPAEISLAPVATQAWGPLVFVNLDGGAPPFAQVFEGIPEPAGLPHVLRREYTIACNWKVYVDNYLEGYHIPFIHPGLHRELDYQGYRVETRRWWSLQHAPLRSAPRHYADEPRYLWIFPNTMLNLYAGQVQTNVIVPLGPERTLTVFDWYGAAPADLVAFSDEIQREDIAICETVHRNLRSRAALPTRYSRLRENGVQHFHSLWQEHMT